VASLDVRLKLAPSSTVSGSEVTFTNTPLPPLAGSTLRLTVLLARPSVTVIVIAVIAATGCAVQVKVASPSRDSVRVSGQEIPSRRNPAHIDLFRRRRQPALDGPDDEREIRARRRRSGCCR
jgi:hypothetical protein